MYARGKNGWFSIKTANNLIEKPTEELAEFIGIMLGDGNIHEIDGKGIYQVRIAGHKIDDAAYFDYLEKLFINLFGKKPSFYKSKNRKTIYLTKQSKDVVHTLKHFGLIPGNKTKNNCGIPSWIFSNNKFLKACVKGLIDTDGSVYPKTKKHKTPTIYFTSAIPELRQDFKKALQNLNYKCSKWVKKSGKAAQDCTIGDRAEVLRYYREIGFSNPKHEKRFKKFWKLALVV